MPEGGGRHFTRVLYSTIASIIGGLAGVAGVAAFLRIFSKPSYRSTALVATLAPVVASVFGFVTVHR